MQYIFFCIQRNVLLLQAESIKESVLPFEFESNGKMPYDFQHFIFGIPQVNATTGTHTEIIPYNSWRRKIYDCQNLACKSYGLMSANTFAVMDCI